MKATANNAALLATTLLLFASFSVRAELLYATDGTNFVSFDSTSPALVTSLAVTGLQPNELLIGLDLRPANGLVYGIGSQNRLYTINPLTGAASFVGGSFTLSGGSFGMDFNPTITSDRIRLVSDQEQNIRINPNDGTLTMADTNLNPAGNIVAAAYTNNFVGSTTTTLYGIDYISGNLVLIGSINGSPNSPNSGIVTNVGSLGIPFTDSGIGFDISGLSGIAFAAITQNPPARPEGGIVFGTRLYSIDLTTGEATDLGFIGDGMTDFVGLTAATAVPEPSSLLLLAAGAGLFLWHRRRVGAKA